MSLCMLLLTPLFVSCFLKLCYVFARVFDVVHCNVFSTQVQIFVLAIPCYTKTHHIPAL